MSVQIIFNPWLPLHWQIKEALRISFASHSFFNSMGGGFSSSTYNGNPCLPPLENSLPCMAWVAWVDQSGTLCKCFIDSWHLDLRCHYLLNYPINCCMHILFQHYISTVIDEYTIHFDGSYWKYDEMVDRKEVNFSRGAHSTNPCGTRPSLREVKIISNLWLSFLELFRWDLSYTYKIYLVTLRLKSYVSQYWDKVLLLCIHQVNIRCQASQWYWT